MLCRLSSLFIYVVAGLVISAAATPAMMGPTSDFNEEPKSRPMVPSYSKSPSHPKPYYPMDKAYARREDAPYPRPHRDEKKYSEKPHSEEKKWNDDKGKEHKPDNYKDRMSVDEKDRKDYGKGRKDDDRYHKDDDKYRKDDDRDRKDDDKYRKDDDRDRKDGDRKDDDKDRKDRDRKDDDRDRKDKDHKDYDNGRKADHDKGRKDYEKVKNYAEDYNPSNAYCNVGEQHCCDTVNTLKEAKELGLLSAFTWGTSAFDATALFGKGCSPFLAEGGGKCEATPICCDKSQVEGLIAIGCSNVNFF